MIMFWKIEKTDKSEIVNKFFDWDISYTHIENWDSTQYQFKNWIYELVILVFNNDVSYNSRQLSLKKDWALIPLEDFEFKLFSKRVKEYIRFNF